MKRILVVTATSALLTTGLLLAPAGAASAGCEAPGCRTVTISKLKVKPVVPVKVGAPARLRITLPSQDGAVPDGTLTISVRGPGRFTAGTSYQPKKLVRTWRTPVVHKRGIYKVRIRFVAAEDSGVRNTIGSSAFRVRR